MKLTMIVAMAGALLIANPAMAQTTCTAPTEPMALDGKTATTEQIMAAKTSVVAFMSASDDYQTCVLDDLKAKEAAAKASKTHLDPAVNKAAQTSIDQNQAAKERVGKWFNSAIKAYKTAHSS